jgi:hypothetical protein
MRNRRPPSNPMELRHPAGEVLALAGDPTVVIPSLLISANNNYNCILQLPTATAGTELRTTYCDYENCELQQLLPSVKPGTLFDRWLQ